MRAQARGRSVLLALALALAVLAVAGDHPAWAITDGPPEIGNEGGPVPQTHRPSGATAVRIYGERLRGTTAVTIGGVPSPDFRVVDGDLLIATVPPAGVPLVQNDGFAHITVTDDEGTATTDLDGDGTVDLADCSVGCASFGAELGAIFYADATFTLSPSTGLDGGEVTTATLGGHRPNQSGWAIVQLNPLADFLEDGPEDPDVIPPGPPYGGILAFPPTDAQGNTQQTNLQVAASPTFNAKDQDYDADADCPVAQVTADHGLDRCMVAYTEFGMATMEAFFRYSPDTPNLDPVPAAPTLALAPNAGSNGTRVVASGVNWNAAPYFGSDTTLDDPGESALIIDVCNVAQTSCAPSGTPDVEVGMTRYFDAAPGVPVTPRYTGATLSGSFTANTAGCAPDCVVRVRQQRYDIQANAPVPGEFITAVARLSAATPPPVDSDGDGVPNANDRCPTTPGMPAREGCPAPTTPTVSPAEEPTNVFSFAAKTLVRRRLTILTLTVPGAGTVKAAQAGSSGSRASASKPLIKPVRVRVHKAGKVRLKIRPSRAGNAPLRRKRRFSVRVRVTFTPTGGKSRSRTKRLRVKR